MMSGIRLCSGAVTALGCTVIMVQVSIGSASVSGRH
jgi:hypothetical protein